MLNSGYEAHHYFGEYTQCTLAAGNKLSKIITGGILQYVSARPDDIAGGKDDLEVEHIIFYYPIFYGAGATTILCHIAAYEAGAAAGRIGRVEEALGFEVLLQLLGYYTRLCGNLEVALVHFQDLVEALHIQRDAAGYGEGATAKAGTGTARGDGNELLVAVAHDGTHFVYGAGLDDHFGGEVEIFGMIGGAAGKVLLIEVDVGGAGYGLEKIYILRLYLFELHGAKVRNEFLGFAFVGKAGSDLC